MPLPEDVIPGVTTGHTADHNDLHGQHNATRTPALRTDVGSGNDQHLADHAALKGWAEAEGITVPAVVDSATHEIAHEILARWRNDSGPATPAPGTTPTVPAEVLDLSNWKLTIDTPDVSGDPDEIRQPQLATFVHPADFSVMTGGIWVAFRAGVAGTSATPNSNYPRTELREMTDSGSTPAAWSMSSGRHEMTIIQKIVYLPDAKPHVVAGQIRDAADDVIMCRIEGTRLFVESRSVDVGVLDESYVLGTEFTVRFLAEAGRVKIYYNDELRVDKPEITSGCYFRAGCYTRSNLSKGEPVTAYGEVQIRSLVVTHT